jgi:predicted GH43/DUF377 family glycosyl hydrolase
MTYAKSLLVLLLLVSMVGCTDKQNPLQSSNDEAGKVSITTLRSLVPSDAAMLYMTLERPNFTTRRDSVNLTGAGDTVRLQVQNVQSGNWTITLTATDNNGALRYRGNGTATVFANQTTVIPIRMQRVGSDLGNISIIVTWEDGNSSSWRFFNGNPILLPTPGSWDADAFMMRINSVVRVGNEYKMWYTIANDGGTTQSIAHATSPDGIVWTKRGIVISKTVPSSAPASWMSEGASNPTVIYENGIYKMWFNGNTSSNVHNGIGTATSTDGLAWTIASTQLIPVSASQPRVFSPNLIKRNGQYYLYYSATASNDWQLTSSKIFVRQSTDAATWQPAQEALASRSNVSWEQGVYIPAVIHNGQRWEMYYTTSPADGNSTIAKAVSTDGITWTRPSSTPELTVANTRPWITSSIGLGTVIYENNQTKLWFTSFDASRNRVLNGYAEKALLP